MHTLRKRIIGGVQKLLVNIISRQLVADDDPNCCCGELDCAACDPIDDDPDPENPEPLDVDITGAATGGGFIYRTAGGSNHWIYASDETNLPLTDGCAEDWVSMTLQVFCPLAGGPPRATANIIRGGDDGCNIESGEVIADSWTCNPFTAQFTFLTVEEPDPNATGCPCGVGEAVIVTVTEP